MRPVFRFYEDNAFLNAAKANCLRSALHFEFLPQSESFKKSCSEKAKTGNIFQETADAFRQAKGKKKARPFRLSAERDELCSRFHPHWYKIRTHFIRPITVPAGPD